MPSRPMHAALVLIMFMLPVAANAAPKADEITSVTKTIDLSFGRLVSFGTTGTATINASGARSSTGGITLLPQGTVAAASFNVVGSSNSTYNITLPAPDTVLLTYGGQNLTITSFICSVPLTGKLGGNKTTMTFTLGATIAVAPSTTPGTYSQTFDVSVTP